MEEANTTEHADALLDPHAGLAPIEYSGLPHLLAIATLKVVQLAAQQTPGTALSPASAAVTQQQSHLLRLAAACRSMQLGASQHQPDGGVSQDALQQVRWLLQSPAAFYSRSTKPRCK